jgi:predicted nucleic acid-binding protein
MKKYLLDSDIITYLEEKNSAFHAPVVSQLSRLSNDDEVYISVLTLYEMQYGIACVKEEPEKYKKFLAVQNSIKRRFPILPLSEKGAEIYGDIKAMYRKDTGIQKKPLKKHDVDFILSSTAVEYDLIIVSNDTIFRKIQEIFNNLQVENWTKNEGNEGAR